MTNVINRRCIQSLPFLKTVRRWGLKDQNHNTVEPRYYEIFWKDISLFFRFSDRKWPKEKPSLNCKFSSCKPEVIERFHCTSYLFLIIWSSLKCCSYDLLRASTALFLLFNGLYENVVFEFVACPRSSRLDSDLVPVFAWWCMDRETPISHTDILIKVMNSSALVGFTLV